MRLGAKNLKISFTGKTLTHFGGIYLIYLFFKQIGLKTLLYNETRFCQRNNRYTISEEILALIYPISLGIGRIEATHLLKYNGVFQYLTGLPDYPNATTLRRFLLRMAPLALLKIKKTPRQDALDNDPKTQTSNTGHLRSGLYSPCFIRQTGDGSYRLQSLSPRGRPSYHPLLCFNGITKDFWHGELRPGDTHTATGILEFLETSFAKLPPFCKKHNYQGRQGLLRPQDCGISGIKENPLCHCCKAYKAHKEKTFRSILQGIFIRYRDRRVYVSTNGLESRIPFCSDTASYSRRPRRTAYPFLNRQIQLSGYCNQHLEVLQRQSLL